MKKRLSVIIPMYNAKAYIKRCIDSILNQGFEGLEIIAVDDGSTDATCSVIQGYADERIRLVRQEKKGVSAARNAGLDLAQGTYVVFADADDYLLDGSLKAMYGTITAQDAELAVFGYINEKNGVPYEKKYAGLQVMERDMAFIHLFRTPAFRGVLWNKIFVRHIIEELHIRFPVEYTHGEDLIFVTRYLKQCSHICVNPRLVYMYAENPDSLCRQMYHKNEFNGKYLILYEAEKVVFSYIEQEGRPVLDAFERKHVETCIDILNRLAHFKLFRHEMAGEIASDIKSHAGQYLFTPDQHPRKLVNIISVLLVCVSPQLFMRVYHAVKTLAWSLGFRSKV